MTKKRTLADLYVRGRELTFDDGQGGEIDSVWIQKLNPVEHTSATRKADAARAKMLTVKYDKECEEYLALLNDVLGADHSILIEMLVAAEEARITPICEAKVADEDPWNVDNYLQGLRDAWRDGIKDAFELDPEDTEAKRVHDELERFMGAVREQIASEVETIRGSLSQTTERELVEMSMDHRIKMAADMAWVNEYYRSEIALGTRHLDDHRKLYFAVREDINLLQLDTYAQLAVAFRDLTVEPVEGKDSAGNPPSSDSSEPSDKEVTEPSSGQPA